MVSNSIDSASIFAKMDGEHASDALANLSNKIHQLKKEIQAERVISVQEKIEANRSKVEDDVSKFLSAATSRTGVSLFEKSASRTLLSSRLEFPLCKFSGIDQEFGDKEVDIHEVAISPSAKLPYIERIPPPYTTWIFLERNQRMADDQSVVGRRRIYYDPHGGSEALICSDSEEDIAEPEDDKHEFSEVEDRILWMVYEEHGFGEEEILDLVSQFVGGTPSEIKDRCNVLKEKRNEGGQDLEFKSKFLGKSLSAALDSYDNLFCRRCLVFDCRLHGCSQSFINPSDRKSSYSSESEEDGKPCGDQCYLKLRVVKDLPEGSAIGAVQSASKTSEEEDKNPVSANVVSGHCSSGSESVDLEFGQPDRVELLLTTNNAIEKCNNHNSAELSGSLSIDGLEIEDNIRRAESEKSGGIAKVHTLEHLSNSLGGEAVDRLNTCQWKPLEKELYRKGIEIFGRNSCLIARNLLSGLKTCIEVSSYMHNDGSTFAPNSLSEDNGKIDLDYMDQEAGARSRLLRKRGRTRKLKYSSKSAGHPSSWKRIVEGKNQSCKQYTPCGCQSMCGKECPCLDNGTCCEKYCGCSKSCKNRFRGCHCAKSQCRSRQCPCFAAGRECDPDVCRNCWVSCGDGSLADEPPKKEGQCGNMRLLLRQQQRILLAKSDVAGWGAFLKNPVNKNDYLGEYTGELISHREADKRGKIYDRANSSFLFDLNDQYVLDAYRKGDKLKFANHSSNPNCYAKVMLVAGDHRVGIFAKEHIEASEELFYDYRYGPDQAPAWARKPEGSKRDDSSSSGRRAKKHQSH